MAKPLAPCRRCGTEPKLLGRGKWYCQSCQDLKSMTLTEKSKASNRTGTRRPKGASIPPGTKWCPRCAKFLKLSTFTRNGKSSYCKDCAKDVYYSTHIVRKYGINMDQYHAILDRQGGCCAICLRVLKTARYAVDHDHKTGEVRGLLCKPCNFRMIASAKDNPETLRRAADYLENPPARGVLLDILPLLPDHTDP